jgi:uncharacterized protein (UPF0335 family)
MSDNDGVLLEDIDHKLQAVLEGQAAMADVPGQISEIDSRLRNVELDVKVIKAVIKDQSKQQGHLPDWF